MLAILIQTCLLWTIVETQLNLYDTELIINSNHLKFNCLRHYLASFDPIEEMIEYCLHPIDHSNVPIADFVNTRDQKFTFDDLYRLNVTTQHLLSWSGSMDVVEQYQHYLNQYNKSATSNEIFYNCTKPWFGTRCQYSFNIPEATTLSDIVQKIILAKRKYTNPHTVTNLTCYTHLKCDRGGTPMCLDWREVCDGRIDCLDGGADEAQCFELEMNECNENEYRCHNGLCIPKAFLKYFDLESNPLPICLDQSDRSRVIGCPYSLTAGFVFSCTEYNGHPSYNQFSCGDGFFVDDGEFCRSGRHHLLAKSMSAKGNLSHDCWMAMSCTTKLIDQIDRISCKQYLIDSDVIAHLHSCEPLIQFPTVPVLFGHVRFLYRPKMVQYLNHDEVLAPDYVCYDEQLCDYLTSTFRYANYTCRYGHEMGLVLNVKLNEWSLIILSIKPYFRGCLTRYKNKNDSKNNLLYCCKNSSKCISKHRIVDGIADCYLNDDEREFELSCSMNDTFRFKCSNGTMCHSPLFDRDICPRIIERHFDEILFQEICDQIVHASPVIVNGINYTDETDCEHWPCKNQYTRSNNFWNCPNGEDEANYTKFYCPPHFLDCVSPLNYTLICLPSNRVNNGIIDCLGASDELQYCHKNAAFDEFYPGFRCWNHSSCVRDTDLCDKRQDCPFGDDEIFCGNHTDVEDILCRLGTLKRFRFSLVNSPTYPSTNGRTIGNITKWPVELHNSANDFKSKVDDPSLVWLCNYGLYAHRWLGGNNYSYVCFCPPNYYGQNCEYQNQRVSLTLTVRRAKLKGMFSIVVTLFDDDDDRQEINSYYQMNYFPFETCNKTFNIYLLYSTRPKNLSKNYSIHINIFDKETDPLRYIGSWYFRIPFLFLPVNRIAAIITVFHHDTPKISGCPLKCHRGECMKYTNEDKFFCQCQKGWSGARCDIPVYTDDCSSDSIWIGSVYNRSICICPRDTFGSHCLVKLSCVEDICENNGSCILMDNGMTFKSYACICPERFIGIFCNTLAQKLEISFHNIEVSSYLLIYILDITNSQELLQPFVIVTLQKLTMFQRTVTLYTSRYLNIVFVKINDNYYLAVLQEKSQRNMSVSITPAQRCLPVNELLNRTISEMQRIRRVKYYYTICQTRPDLMCFFDDFFMCLCTLEHHANCLKFDHTPKLCEHNTQCLNRGTCITDESLCPKNTACKCTDCFFGDRCQYYAKGVGLTLDDILRYEIHPNITLSGQPTSVKVSIGLVVIMFVAGLINSILSFLTFYQGDSRKVGCGMYLLASSITSFLTVSMLQVKFWLIITTHINPLASHSILQIACAPLETILKLCLYMDNWLNACVAIERAVTVFKGVNFNKTLSKRVAKWVIFILPFFIILSIIYEPIYRVLMKDDEEQRIWCMIRYSQAIYIYSTIIIFFHFGAPLTANLLSALFIIFRSARQRAAARTQQNYNEHLREQFKERKYLIISPIVLVFLSLPRLIIAFLSECVKSSRNRWIYLFGYFVSFVPSVIVFLVFVLPSDLYKQQFVKSMRQLGLSIRQQ